jgi:hypothetical protein
VTEVTFPFTPQLGGNIGGVTLQPFTLNLAVRAKITTGRDGVVKKIEQLPQQ